MSTCVAPDLGCDHRMSTRSVAGFGNTENSGSENATSNFTCAIPPFHCVTASLSIPSRLDSNKKGKSACLVKFCSLKTHIIRRGQGLAGAESTREFVFALQVVLFFEPAVHFLTSGLQKDVEFSVNLPSIQKWNP
jgi:hypothetical protein